MSREIMPPMEHPGAVRVIVMSTTSSCDADAVHQPEVEDIDRNFRVVALAQDLVNVFFCYHRKSALQAIS